MYCRNCGKNLAEGSKFCDGCGAPTGVTAPQQPQSQPQAQYRPQPQPQAQYRPQPQPQAQYQPQPQYRQPVSGKKSPILPIVIAAAAVLILVAVVAVIALLGGKAPVSELFAYGDWSYAAFELYDGTYVTRSASISETDEIEEIWDTIGELEIKETKDGAVDEIRGNANVNLFMMDDTAENTVYLAVTEDGRMYVNYNDDATRYFSGCQEVYAALSGFLPSGDTASMEECVPDGWESASITFYAPGGAVYDNAYISGSEDMSRFVDRLQGYEAKFGGGTYSDFEGYYATVSLFGENNSMLYLVVYEDGNADFPMGDWTVGFYDAVDIYDMLWEELCIANGYY